jgi:hypothetical protein
MARVFVLAALLYGWGGPAWDGQRPDALDRPLRNFHRVVDTATADAGRALSALNVGRSLATALRPLHNAF